MDEVAINILYYIIIKISNIPKLQTLFRVH